MKKIVLLGGISEEVNLLIDSLGILFPECKIEIHPGDDKGCGRVRGHVSILPTGQAPGNEK